MKVNMNPTWLISALFNCSTRFVICCVAEVVSRNRQASYANRYAPKSKEACLWNRAPRLRPAVLALEIEQ